MRNLFLPYTYLKNERTPCGSHVSAVIAEAGSPYSANMKGTKQITVLKHLLLTDKLISMSIVAVQRSVNRNRLYLR